MLQVYSVDIAICGIWDYIVGLFGLVAEIVSSWRDDMSVRRMVAKKYVMAHSELARSNVLGAVLSC